MSMTGHGQGLVQNDQVRVLAEVRSVNNRFLKINIGSDLGPEQEAQVESLIRESVNRGSINLRLKTQFVAVADDYRLNTEVLQAYAEQLAAMQTDSSPLNLESFLTLPGVIEVSAAEQRMSTIWPAIRQATREALKMLCEMRATEGAAMQQDMRQNCEIIVEQVDKIEKLAPQVIGNYTRRMTERVNHLLEQYQVTLEPAELVREVGIFAERCDIAEEIVRLRSHLAQFSEIQEEPESNGRKLDFIVQEMLRETNTIGSKANDAQIASHVVEIKTAIERVREMVQNVE